MIYELNTITKNKITNNVIFQLVTGFSYLDLNVLVNSVIVVVFEFFALFTKIAVD